MTTLPASFYLASSCTSSFLTRSWIPIKKEFLFLLRAFSKAHLCGLSIGLKMLRLRMWHQRWKNSSKISSRSLWIFLTRLLLAFQYTTWSFYILIPWMCHFASTVLNLVALRLDDSEKTLAFAFATIPGPMWYSDPKTMAEVITEAHIYETSFSVQQSPQAPVAHLKINVWVRSRIFGVDLHYPNRSH